jgi:hypothetical protein
MADPTLTRKYYSDASRRKSGATGQKTAATLGSLPGEAYSQGYITNNLLAKRSMLPVLGRQSDLKSVLTYRVDDGSASNRTVFAIEDFQSNAYFLDTDKLIKSKFKASLEHTVPTTDNLLGFILPDGDVLEATQELKDIFFDKIKPALDLTGFLNYSGNVPIPVEYQNNFKKYQSIALSYTAKPQVTVTFPDGGIRQEFSFRLPMESYGYGQEFNPDTVFTELQKFNAIEFVRSSAPLGMFPETSKSPSYSNENIYNGIIEPFNIRDEIYGKETFAVDDKKPGSLSGDITDPIEFSYSVTETTKGAIALYEDVAIPNTADGYLQEVYVSETVYRPDAYEDRDPYDSVYVDEELENVLISMDATLDEGVLSVRHIDMTVGFDGISKDRFGSMVYRGLLR